MRTTTLIKSILILFLLCGAGFAHAQTSGNHTVTVHVGPMVYLTLSKLALSITVTGAGAVAGVDSMRATDQSILLNWATNYNAGKITVSTNLAAGSQHFILRVRAVNTTAPGVAQSERVLVSGTAFDFVTGVAKSLGSCNLLYTCVSKASQGAGPDDNHTITYTITIL